MKNVNTAAAKFSAVTALEFMKEKSGVEIEEIAKAIVANPTGEMANYDNHTISQLIEAYRYGYITILCADKQEVLDIIFEGKAA